MDILGASPITRSTMTIFIDPYLSAIIGYNKIKSWTIRLLNKEIIKVEDQAQPRPVPVDCESICIIGYNMRMHQPYIYI
jgi:hypothetical protein